MAQAGYTPIQLYYSTTAAAVPLAANLAQGELAINIADGKLYYENSSGVVTLLAGAGGAGIVAGSNTQLQFNNNGVFGASANLTWNGTSLSATQIDITAQGPLRLQDTTGGEYVGLRSPASLGASYTLTFPADDGTSGQALITDGSGGLSWSTAASGDVYGPASATANGIVLFDSTTGKLIKDSAASDGLIYSLTVGRGGGAVSTNTAFGVSALSSNLTGSDTTAVGYRAYRLGTGVNNTAFGSLALGGAIVTGSENTALGRGALLAHTSGNNNIAVGSLTLLSNTTGGNNVAIGVEALGANTTASSNTAVGYRALYLNTTGTANIAIGQQALQANTTASNNTAIGYQAAILNTTGASNVAVGDNALRSNTTASNNTAVGYQAGYTNQTGGANVFIGYQAGYTSNAVGTGVNLGYNTCVGPYAGYGLTTGVANCFIGSSTVAGPSTYGSGQYVTTGSYNTILGGYNGNQGGLDIRTASNYIVLSDGAGNPTGVWDSNGEQTGYSTANGIKIRVSSSGTGAWMYWGGYSATNVTNGTQSFGVYSNGNVVNTNNSYGSLSDVKLKENIVDATSKLANLMQVQVRNYNFKSDPDKLKQIGVIAQELETVFPSLVDVDEQTGDKSVKYSVFVPMLIKAMQEQQAIIESLKARLDAANL